MLVMQSVFTGPIYVVRDNIDTDQIISAQYLNLGMPTIPEEYDKLGSYAARRACRRSLYATRYVKEGQTRQRLSYRRRRPEFRLWQLPRTRAHCAGLGQLPACARRELRAHFLPQLHVATGELGYPCEITERLCDVLKTGDVVTVDLDKATVTAQATGKVYHFKPLGDVRPVVDAGGIFNYARQSGMISK